MRSKIKKEKIHPSVYGVVVLLLVGIARLPEILPQLTHLQLGKLSLLYALFGLFLFKEKSDLKGILPDDKIQKLINIFFGLCAFSVFISIWPGNSFKYFFPGMIVVYFAAFIFIKSAVNERVLNIYTNTLVACALLLSIKTVSLSQTGRVEVDSAYDANDLAQVLVSISPLLIIKILSAKNSAFLFYVGSLVIILAAVLLTGSRGGLVGMASVGLYLAFKLITNKKTFFKVIFFSIMLIVIGISLSPSYTVERFNSMFNLEDDYNLTDNQGRIAIWGRGINTMFKYPLGVGIDSYSVAEGEAGGTYKASHNQLIQTGAEIGFIGLFVFLKLFLESFRSFKELKRSANMRLNDLYMRSLGVRAALVGYFVTGFFLSSAYLMLLYVLFGLAIAIKYNYMKYGIVVETANQEK